MQCKIAYVMVTRHFIIHETSFKNLIMQRIFIWECRDNACSLLNNAPHNRKMLFLRLLEQFLKGIGIQNRCSTLNKFDMYLYFSDILIIHKHLPKMHFATFVIMISINTTYKHFYVKMKISMYYLAVVCYKNLKMVHGAWRKFLGKNQ